MKESHKEIGISWNYSNIVLRCLNSFTITNNTIIKNLHKLSQYEYNEIWIY